MSTGKTYQFGISEYTTWPWTFEQDVAAYAAAGVECIEVCEAKLDPGRASEQLATIVKAGLKISTVQPRVHSLYPDQPRPQPPTPEERMALYAQTIELFGTSAPGATLVTITGAAPGGDFREAFATAIREYGKLADLAADHGLRIALEPLNPILMNVDSFICSLPDVMKIVEAVDRPNFGVMLDVWHVWQDPAAVERIMALGDRIFAVHLSDWNTPRHFGDRYTLGTGEINLPDLVRAIHSTGYSGAYTVEIFSEEWLENSLWKSDLSELIRVNKSEFDKIWRGLSL